jgi:hypothetical protein
MQADISGADDWAHVPHGVTVTVRATERLQELKVGAEELPIFQSFQTQ